MVGCSHGAPTWLGGDEASAWHAPAPPPPTSLVPGLSSATPFPSCSSASAEQHQQLTLWLYTSSTVTAAGHSRPPRACASDRDSVECNKLCFTSRQAENVAIISTSTRLQPTNAHNGISAFLCARRRALGPDFELRVSDACCRGHVVRGATEAVWFRQERSRSAHRK